MTLVNQSQELKIVSYHKLYDILKQHQNEVNKIRAERLARTANPLALVAQQQPVYHPQNHPTHYTQNSSTKPQQAATRNRDDAFSKEKEIDKLIALISLSFKKIYKPTNNNLITSSNTSRANQDNTPRINKGTRYDNQRAFNVVEAKENVDAAGNYGPIFDVDPLQKVPNDDDNYNVFANDREHLEQPESVNVTYLKEHSDTNITTDSLDMSDNRRDVDQDEDEDLARERDLIASLIEKIKCEIDESKDCNKLLESSNKILVDKLKSEIKDFKNKNKCLESSSNHFKEANTKLAKNNQLMFKDLKKFQAKLDRYHDVNYASKVEIDCAKAKGELISYKILLETYPFSLNTAYSTSNVDTTYPGTIFRDPPYLFDYLTRRLTMEEILAKFIDEGRHEHEEMEIFIKEFRTTNELLLKTQSNLLSELKIEVNELSKVVSNVLIPKNEVKGVTTREGKMTFEATHSEEIKEARIDKNKPPRFEHNVQEKPHDDGVENKSSSIPERTTQPSVKPQQSSIPFPNRLNELPFKEKDQGETLLLVKYWRNIRKQKEIADKFSDEHLMELKSKFKDDEPWYADFVNYIVGKVVPPNWTFEKRKRFFSQVKTYFWEEPYAFKLCADNIMRRCVPGSETLKILAHCHSGPTVAVDYVSKWVEAQALPTNDALVVVKFLRSLFARFGVPKALISDRGTHFCNSQLEKALQRYDVTHKLSTTYHPQSNGQTEVNNRAIKRILERSVGYNPKGWSEKLNDALWAFRTAYKTPIGCTPFRLVYGKVCHLPVKIKHKAHWALKQCNLDLTLASKSHLMQLNELAKLRDDAYESTRIYKEQTKKWHDSRLCGDKDFKVGDQVLLYNSRLKMYPGKLKSKWSGPNIVKTMYPHGAIEITDRDRFSFKINGQRLKKYYGGDIDKEDDEVIELENDITRSWRESNLKTLTKTKVLVGRQPGM
ncbi:reverse transcriptase domain-containing protein [Tanacetum coccineum]